MSQIYFLTLKLWNVESQHIFSEATVPIWKENHYICNWIPEHQALRMYGVSPTQHGQVERFSRTTASLLQYQMVNHWRSWNIFVNLKIYTYFKRLHKSSDSSRYSFVLCPHMPRTWLTSLPSSLSSSVTDKKCISNDSLIVLILIQALHSKTKMLMRKIKAR